MDRPEYPNCVMPAETIARIRSDQEAYDEDPEYFERLQAQQEEAEGMAQLEAQAMEEAQRQAQADAEAEAQYMQGGPEGQ